MDTLPLEIIGEIAAAGSQVYLGLIRAHPAFARSLTLGDRLDFAEKFGYDCRINERCTAWTRRGKLHRIGGPALDYLRGGKEWYVDGKLNNANGGPTVIYHNEIVMWHVNDELHRTDGPAIEYPDTRDGEFYLFGTRYDKADFEEVIAQNFP